jgi:catalase
VNRGDLLALLFVLGLRKPTKGELILAEASRLSPGAAIGSLALIAGVVAFGAAAFAYTAGWLSPERLTPQKLVDGFTGPSGPPLGHRRNHAKGICFTGVFESNGAGSELSQAQVFVQGKYPVVGRFNLGTPNPNADDAKERVRGLGLMISTPDGQEWRMALIDLPFFPVATPEAFRANQIASASKDPDAMAKFAQAHPEFAAFGAWAGSAPWTGSYAEERYNNLNSFIFTDASGNDHAVRWSLAPAAQPVPVAPDELAKRGPDFLETEIAERIKSGPLRWTMLVTVANAGDETADPSKAWPQDRRSVEVGSLVVQQIEPERDGPCRDINFDPTVLPNGMRTSDDPFPAARSAAYRVSYDRRTAEEKDYPRTATGSGQ